MARLCYRPPGRVVGARGATRSGWPLPQPGTEQVGRRGLGRRPQPRPSAGISRYQPGASFRPWRSCGGPSGAPCGADGGGGSLLPSLAQMTPLLVSGQSFLLNGHANISARRLAVNQLAALGRLAETFHRKARKDRKESQDLWIGPRTTDGNRAARSDRVISEPSGNSGSFFATFASFACFAVQLQRSGLGKWARIVPAGFV